MKIDYGRSMLNVKTLLDFQKEYKSKLKIRISMVLTKFNENDVDKFKKMFGNEVDSISINKAHSYSNEVEQASEKNLINFNKKTYPCKYIWNTIVVSVTGDILLCCLDYNADNKFGNIQNSDLLSIFDSEKFKKIRNLHYSNDIEKISICKNCYTPYKNGAEWLIKDLL